MSLTTGLIPIDEVVYFDICTHDPSTGGVGDADSTPTFSVFEEATDTPIVSGTSFTKRTSLTGDYRGTFTASAANGFEAGKWYSIIASATVGAVTAKKNCGSFRVAPAETTAGVPVAELTTAYDAAKTAASQASVDTIDGIVDDILVDTGTTLQAELDGIQADTEDIQTRLPAALTGAGNLKADAQVVSDKTGYAIASGGIISGAHAAAELNAMADAFLDRNMATGTDSGANNTTTRTVRQALRRLRNKESIAAGTLTITKEDDSTTSWTATVTTTAGDPLSAVDPA